MSVLDSKHRSNAVVVAGTNCCKHGTHNVDRARPHPTGKLRRLPPRICQPYRRNRLRGDVDVAFFGVELDALAAAVDLAGGVDAGLRADLLAADGEAGEVDVHLV